MDFMLIVAIGAVAVAVLMAIGLVRSKFGSKNKTS